MPISLLKDINEDEKIRLEAVYIIKTLIATN